MSITTRVSYRKHLPTAILTAVVSVFLLGGCALSGAAGGLVRDPDVTHLFESYKADPQQYRYYYSGWSNNPYAIVAIDRQYTLNDRLWTAFTPDGQTLKKLMNALYEDYNFMPSGAHLVDQNGRRIGLWYSCIRGAGVRVDPQTGIVDIITDKPYLSDDVSLFNRF